MTRLALPLACTLGSVLILSTAFRRGWTHVETDFPNYYTAAVLTVKHQPLRQFYDWTWFQRQMNYAGTERQLGGYIPHTPLTMLPLLPLTALAPQRAKHAWLIFGVLCLAASLWMLARVTALPTAVVWALALVSWTALSDNLIMGQYYLFFLLLLTSAVWCLLRDRPATGGALMGAIFGLKLYTAPFILYFAVRRQWRALAGMAATMTALLVLAIAIFGAGDLRHFGSTVLARALDATTNDPYSTGWSSMGALLRRAFVPEAESNPHPLIVAPAAFFFLRDLYSLGILALTLAALARDWRDERPALAWFLIVLFVISPEPAPYHFLLLLVPIALLVPGASAPWAAGLVALYALVELPLFAWSEPFFQRVWPLLALFLYAGWASLRALDRRTALAVLSFVVAISTARAWRNARAYQHESTRVAARAVRDPDNVYSSAPVLAGERMLYEKIDQERYLLVEARAGKLRELPFEGEALHPALGTPDGPVYFELVAGRHSRICRFDVPKGKLETVIGPELDPTEPAVSVDGAKLAFVSRGSLYLRESGRITRLALSGPISDPAFFPDGRRLAFAEGRPGRRVIRSMTLPDGAPATLVSGADGFQPAISPDGRWLAYVAASPSDRQIWVLDLATGARRRLTTGACQNDRPAFRGDSRAIVFASDCDRGLGLASLFVLPL